jgi:hypothetical protein
LPELATISFAGIPATEQRFALAQATFLVIDSEEAWTQQFGAEPPPAQPAINWKREIVIGAFLGPEAAGVQVSVSSIVQRDHTVSIWLATAGEPSRSAGAGGNDVPRVLVRVQRDEINANYKGPAPELVYAFLNDKGQLLAQGPAGAVEPVGVVTAFQEKAMPVPGGQTTPVPEIAAPAPGQGTLEAAAPAIEATSGFAAPAAEAPAQPPTRSAASRVWFGIWLVLVIAAVGAVVVGVSIYFWRRRHQAPEG